MTRAELIDALCRRMPHLQVHAVKVWVHAVFEHLTSSLEAGERVELRGFGSFFVRHRDPRTTRNPKTGEPVTTQAKSVPRFKAGKELREWVNTACAQRQG